jgi:tetratricopeptide (TPR) repeat protein
LDDAEHHYRRALATKERLLGRDHPDVAMTQNNLALLLASSGRNSEAEPLYARALQTFAATLEPDHPKIQGCMANYAAFLREQGRGAAARSLAEKYSTEIRRT